MPKISHVEELALRVNMDQHADDVILATYEKAPGACCVTRQEIRELVFPGIDFRRLRRPHSWIFRGALSGNLWKLFRAEFVRVRIPETGKQVWMVPGIRRKSA